METSKAEGGGGGGGGSGGKSKEKNQNIQVFVRVRPMSSQELSKNPIEIIDTPGNREVVVRERSVANLTKTFTFDRVFGPKSKQIDVYKVVVSPLLSEVLLGYNCTVFAYGQTGTGKTFTMEGERKSNSGVENDPMAGILPRTLSQLFDELRLMNCEFSVRASFLELYNEELFDLLAPIEESKAKTLRLFEDATRKGSVIIQGLEEVIVNNKHEIYAVLDKGSQQRKTAATLMNASSSRSHTIFTITVHIKESSVEGEEMVKVGKLHLVDLAGSENIGKSGAVEKRAREAGSINQSLLTLGRVISALVERAPHVPYRESKLTRLLQDSLGGKTKTSIIATISPAALYIEETLSTLDYAHRAKNIMNRPEVNQKISKKEAITMYTDEIERLRKDLYAARDKNGFYMDQANYDMMVCQLQSQTHELNEKSNKIKDLEDSLTNKEEELKAAEDMIDDLKLDVETKQRLMDALKEQKQKLENKLACAYRKNDELNHLIKYHEDTEGKMSSEAATLLDTTKDTISIIEQLHGRLERKHEIEQTNWDNAGRFREDFRQSMDKVIENVHDIKSKHTIGISELRMLLNSRNMERKQDMDSYTTSFYKTTTKMITLTASMTDVCSKFLSVAKQRTEESTKSIDKEGVHVQEKLSVNMDSLHASLKSLMGLFRGLKGDLKSLEQEIAIKFDAMNKIVTESLSSDIAQFSQTEEMLTELRDKWSSIVDLVLAKCNFMQAETERFKESHNKGLKSLTEMMLQLQTDSDRCMKRTGDTISFIQETLAESKDEIGTKIKDESDNIKEASISTEGVLQKFPEFRTENVTNHQTMVGRMHDRIELEEKNFSNISSRLDNIKKDCTEGFAATSSAVSQKGKETIEEFSKIDKQLSHVLEQHSEEMKNLREGSLQNVNKITDGEGQAIEKLVDQVDKQCDLMSTGCTEVASALAYTSGYVEEFWEETYLTDVRTGTTPMRKKFDYPTKLSRPSPHSRVIARYRSARRGKGIQETIDELADDDSNCSGSPIIGEKCKLSEILDDIENENPDKLEIATEQAVTAEKNESKDSVVMVTPPDSVNEDSTPWKGLKVTVQKKNAAKNKKGGKGENVDTTPACTPGVKQAKQQQQHGKNKGNGSGNKGVLKPPN